MTRIWPRQENLPEAPAEVNMPDFHGVMTMPLCELIECHWFDWEKPYLDWREAAFDEEQYSRICEQFISRFYYDEPGITPLGKWAQRLVHMLKFELMPKYRPMYQRGFDQFSPLAVQSEYKKQRDIVSEYPETLISGNSDYVNSGHDLEYEVITEGDTIEKLDEFARLYRSIDMLLLDELEVLFSHLKSTDMGVW